MPLSHQIGLTGSDPARPPSIRDRRVSTDQHYGGRSGGRLHEPVPGPFRGTVRGAAGDRPADAGADRPDPPVQPGRYRLPARRERRARRSDGARQRAAVLLRSGLVADTTVRELRNTVGLDVLQRATRTLLAAEKLAHSYYQLRIRTATMQLGPAALADVQPGEIYAQLEDASGTPPMLGTTLLWDEPRNQHLDQHMNWFDRQFLRAGLRR